MRYFKYVVTITLISASLFFLSSCSEASISMTIHFDSRGGSTVESITYDDTIDFIFPEDPTKEGYTFTGWYLDEASNQIFNFYEISIEEVTLYAGWDVNAYKITFQDDDDEIISILEIDYATNLSMIDQLEPQKEGYTFSGWDIEMPLTMPAFDLTLKANYSINQYTIDLNTNGGSVIEPLTLVYGSIIEEIDTPTREGYSFVGWYLDDGFLEAFDVTTMPAHDLDLYAKWEIETFGLTFFDDDDSVISFYDIEYGTDLSDIDTPGGNKIGYTFLGWDTSLPNKMPAHDVTLKAMYSINNYTITFNSNGGSDIQLISLEFGSEINLPEEPVREGYTFIGWYTDEHMHEIYDFLTMPSEDFTVYAGWEINIYKITFVDENSAVIDMKDIQYGTDLLSINMPNPSKEGHTFIGWDSLPFLKMPAYDLTFKAMYTINQYTITFETNGGSALSAITQDYDSEINAPDIPTKNGFTFVGWFADENLNESYVFTTLPAQDITVYVKWEIKHYDVTFQIESGIPYDVIENVEHGSTITMPIPEKEGYLFVHWLNNNELFDDTHLVVNDITLIATWVQEPSLSLEMLYARSDSVTYDLNIEDPDNVLYIQSIHLLYKDFVIDSTMDTSRIEFTSLAAKTNYSIQVTYHFPLISVDESYIVTSEFYSYSIKDDVGSAGFGYDDLINFSNGLNMQRLYLDMLQSVDQFKLGGIDYPLDQPRILIDTFDLFEYGVTSDEALSTWKVFMFDHPSYYWFMQTSFFINEALHIYALKEFALASTRNQIDDLVDQMIQDLNQLIDSSIHELDKVKIIYDYIANRVNYAYEDDGLTPQDDQWAHNMSGIANKQGAVCEGYAESLMFLLNVFEIDNILVSGTSNNQLHMWNMIKINENYYHFDLTWDDVQLVTDLGETIYRYFGLSSQNIIKDHQIESSQSSGLEYLYDLPVTPSNDLAMVDAYENDVYQGRFNTIDDAFASFNNASSEYRINLLPYLYNYVIETELLPQAESITIIGNAQDYLDGAWVMFKAIRLLHDVSSQSDLEFVDLFVTTLSFYEVTLDVGNHSVIAQGTVHFGDPLSFSIVNIIGDNNSEMDLRDGTVDFNGTLTTQLIKTSSRVIFRQQVNVDTFIAYEGWHLSTARSSSGEIAHISINHFISEAYSNLISVYGNMPQVNIGTYSNIGTFDTEHESFGALSLTIHFTEAGNVHIDSLEIPKLTINFKNKDITAIISNSTIHVGNYDEIDHTIWLYDEHNNTTNITDLMLFDNLGILYLSQMKGEIVEEGILISAYNLLPNQSEYIIPEGIHTIGENAFQSFNGLKRIFVPSYVTHIHDYAFSQANSLEYVFLENPISSYDSEYLKYSDLSRQRFYIITPEMNPELETGTNIITGFLDMQDNGEFVYILTAYNYIYLIDLSDQNTNNHIVIPDDIDGTPVMFFSNRVFTQPNFHTTAITIGRNIQRIPDNAINGFYNLEYIFFQDNSQITEIGNSFINLLKLKEVHIPASVTYVAHEAFYGSDNVVIYLEQGTDTSQWANDWNLIYFQDEMNFVYAVVITKTQ